MESQMINPLLPKLDERALAYLYNSAATKAERDEVLAEFKRRNPVRMTQGEPVDEGFGAI
jgi:hypothetical protein